LQELVQAAEAVLDLDESCRARTILRVESRRVEPKKTSTGCCIVSIPSWSKRTVGDALRSWRPVSLSGK